MSVGPGGGTAPAGAASGARGRGPGPDGRAPAEAVFAAEIAQLNATYERVRSVRTNDPAHQQLIEREARAATRVDYAAFYRERRMTGEQREAFEGLLAERTLAMVDLQGAARALGLALTDPAVAAMRERGEQAFRNELEALLGRGGHEAAQRYDALALVRGVVSKVAGETSFTAAPLTAAQGRQLAEILTRHDPLLTEPDSGIEEARIDWTEVVAEAQSVLAPEQLEALRGAAAYFRWRGEYTRALTAARNP